MPKPFSIEIRNQWREKIVEQQESGLSIASWCRINNVSTHNFCYWRNKFFPKTIQHRSAFKEILDKEISNNFDQRIGIILECNGVRICLDEQFNSCALKKCLEVLKGLTC